MKSKKTTRQQQPTDKQHVRALRHAHIRLSEFLQQMDELANYADLTTTPEVKSAGILL